MVYIKDYKYKEREFAELIYSNGLQSKYMTKELTLLALYFRDVLHMRPKTRKAELYQFCEKNVTEFEPVKYFKVLNRVLLRSSKKDNRLIQIDQMDVYCGEMDYLNSLNVDDNEKKVLFTFLIMKKLDKAVYELKKEELKKEDIYENKYFCGNKANYNDVKKRSNIPRTLNINSDIIYNLVQKNLITSLYNGFILLDYLAHCKNTGGVAFTMYDFENMGYAFDYYNGVKGVKKCKNCGRPFKQKNNKQKYCGEDCSTFVNKIKTSERKKSMRSQIV